MHCFPKSSFVFFLIVFVITGNVQGSHGIEATLVTDTPLSKESSTTTTIAKIVATNTSTENAVVEAASEISSSTRTGRIMKFLTDPKSAVPHRPVAVGRDPSSLQFKRPRLAQKLRPRVDHPVTVPGLNIGLGPGPAQQPAFHVPHHNPRFSIKGSSAADPNIMNSIRKQILRRVQNGLGQNTPLRPFLSNQPPLQRHQPQQPLRFNYDIVKSSNYSPVKQSSPHIVNHPFSVRDNEGKPKVIYPQVNVASHPNSLGPVLQRDRETFKASPPFNGNAIVRPKPTSDSEAVTYTHDIKQYPLPQQPPQHQAYQQFHQAYQPVANIKSETQALLQTQSNSQQHPQQALMGDTRDSHYSVFEDPEITEHAQMTHNSQHNALTFSPEQTELHASEATAAAKEASDYLRFMSSNEYFLPKFDPNYKKIDEQKDLQQYQQHYRHQPQQQVIPQHQQPDFQHNKPLLSDALNEASFQHPIQVSQLFYQNDPSPSSTVVRGSYQTGSNIFVVKSDGNKAVKHIVPSSLATEATVPEYTEVHFNSQRSHTQEPLRFEFTEKDAVPSTYTNAPNSHLRYKAVNPQASPQMSNHIRSSNMTPTTARSTTLARVSQKSANAIDSDPEDGEDMQQAGSHNFGRVPVRTSTENSKLPAASLPKSSSGPVTSAPTATTPELKDTEAYCERICANVQDNDEEIICGSDGYMYTGEAQMECYGSCLNIDIAIQGKGSCSAR